MPTYTCVLERLNKLSVDSWGFVDIDHLWLSKPTEVVFQRLLQNCRSNQPLGSRKGQRGEGFK